MNTTCKLERPESERIYHEAEKYIPGGVNSPVRSFKNLGIPPIVVREGRRDEIVDVDGHTYIDFCNSWGALIHGHAHPMIVEAVTKQLCKGTSFGITTEIEGKIAKRITQDIPSIKKIRFVSSGTEATMSALRLARGFTGRDAILKFSGCYHGHGDLLLVQAGSGVAKLNATSTSKGVPHDAIKHTLVLPYNDINMTKALLRELGVNIAAVILEPIACNMGVVPAEKAFLKMLREETQKTGTLLIIDEVVTGYRLSLGGAQAYYGIEADLTCLGKIIGGGFPAAAFGGREEIMNQLAPLGEVYQAGTLSGNPVAMVAGYTALSLIDDNLYKRLEAKTDLLLNPLQEYVKRKELNIAIQRASSMFTIFFGAQEVKDFNRNLDAEQFRHFYSYVLEKGIYFSPSQYEGNFISDAHSEEHLIYTRDVILEYLESFY